MKGRHLKGRARQLRRNPTETEKRMWWLLRSEKFQGYKFRRQQPIGPYIVDFCCLGKKLIIELDGGQHAFRTRQDKDRTEFLEREGFQVIRFWDHEIFQQEEGVLGTLLSRLKGSPSPPPSPLKGEGRRCESFNIPC